MNDDSLIRHVLTRAVRDCPKSREEIVGEMTALVDTRITVAMLNAFTADAKRCHRWPSAWTRAFCRVTGDDTLLRAQAELAGYHVITKREAELLKLGRQVMARRRANRAIKRMVDQEDSSL